MSDLLDTFEGSRTGDSQTSIIMVTASVKKSMQEGGRILTVLCPEAVVSPQVHFSNSPLQPSTRCSGKEIDERTEFGILLI